MSAKTPRRFRLAGQTAALALAVGAIGVGAAGTAHAGDGGPSTR